MNATHDNIEDRLRRALAARAEQVTPSSLRSGTPVRTAPPRKVTWRAPMLAAAAAATVLLAGVTYAGLQGITGQPAPGPATAPPQPKVVTGSTCPREGALIGAALRREEGVLADVDGDGAPDRVVTAVDDQGERGCRAFVGVRTAAGTTYSTAMADVWGRRLVFPPEVIGVPVLGKGTGAEVVVDTHARADGAFAQLFTLTDAGLVQVRVPGGQDGGSFLVEGGGVTFPSGADCRADGSLVVSSAAAQRQSFQVTQRVYTLDGDRLTETGSTKTVVSGNDLFRQFPEFGAPHFAACGGKVR